jgi:hypothetical protein
MMSPNVATHSTNHCRLRARSTRPRSAAGRIHRRGDLTIVGLFVHHHERRPVGGSDQAKERLGVSPCKPDFFL